MGPCARCPAVVLRSSTGPMRPAWRAAKCIITIAQAALLLPRICSAGFATVLAIELLKGSALF